MRSAPIPIVTFQPEARAHFLRGVRVVVDAIRPTLGPLPRLVAIQPQRGIGRMPELLDCGAVIARRLIAIPDGRADPGAMYVRHMLWRLYEATGDGTATAAVLFEAALAEGARLAAAGHDTQQLRRHLERGAAIVGATLAGLRVPLAGRAALARAAASICADAELADVLAEALDIVGGEGQLDVRSRYRPGVEREYLEGMIWEAPPLARALLAEAPQQRVQLEDAALLVSDLELDDPRAVVPLLERVVAAGRRALVIVADHASEPVLALLAANARAGQLRLLAVRTPGTGPAAQRAALDDLAVLTGAAPLHRAAGDRLERVGVERLGQARRAWATLTHFGLTGGKGDPRGLRQHIAALRAARAASAEADARRALDRRVGQLLGGSATVFVGGATDVEVAHRKELAQRAAAALRGALREGVVPGGGAALLACRPALRRAAEEAATLEEAAVYRALARAVEAPARAIAANAGYEPERALRDLDGDAWRCFDARSGRVVDAADAGIIDAAAALQAAAHAALSSAALALTVEAHVHRPAQEGSIEP